MNFMKKILIAATLAGIAGAAVILYLKNRRLESEEYDVLVDPNDHHRNPLGRVVGNLKRNGIGSQN